MTQLIGQIEGNIFCIARAYSDVEVILNLLLQILWLGNTAKYSILDLSISLT